LYAVEDDSAAVRRLVGDADIAVTAAIAYPAM